MDAISGDVGTNVGSIGVNAVSRSVIVDLGSCGGVTSPSGAEWVPKGVTHGPTLPRVSYSRCRIFKRSLPDFRATFYGTDPMGSMGSNRSAVSSQSTELNGTDPMGSIGSNRSVGYGPNVEEGLPKMGSMHALFAEADSDGCIGAGVLVSPVSGRLPTLFLPSICVAMGIRASPTETNFYTISSKWCKIQLQPTPFLTPFHQNLVQMNSATPNLVFHYSCTILFFLVLLFNF